jgi:pantothenate kinase type III
MIHLNHWVLTESVLLKVHSICTGEHSNLPEREFIISIDFGTATTVNIVKPPADFIGGMIAPGPKMMLRALQNHTAQLPKVNPENYSTLIAQDTKSSIASGVINSTVGLVEKIINHMYIHHNAKDLHIYITGGNAEYLFPQFDFEFIYEKALVLYGIKAIYEKNKRSQAYRGIFINTLSIKLRSSYPTGN